jgi:hypothetical protein
VLLLPLAARLPLQAPEPLQLVALAELQFKVADPPGVTILGVT